jgi:hypothetical protein
MEITEEVWEIMLDYTDYSQGCMVVSLDCWWNYLTWNHIALQEREQVYNELRNFESSLVECSVRAITLESIWILEAGNIDEL